MGGGLGWALEAGGVLAFAYTAGIGTERGQGTEQAIEGAEREAFLRAFGPFLGLRCGRRFGRGHGIARGADLREFLVDEEEGSQGFAHMPFDIVRQHTQEQVSADASLQAVMDGADAQVQALERPEGLLDIAQAFVSPHGVLCAQRVGRLWRADDIDPIQCLLAGNGVFLSRPTQHPVGDLHGKVFGDLVTAKGPTDLLADLRVGERFFGAAGYLASHLDE